MTDIVVIIHVCRPDWHLGLKWLHWSRWLAKQPTARPYRLVVFAAQSLGENDLAPLRAALAGWDTAIIETNPDGDERGDLGYAYLANKAFRNALECTESLFPGHPTLWVETDCIPIRPSWLREIDEEYKAKGRPFLGDFHALGPIPHMTGNAVYPADWRTKAPSLARLPGPNPAQGWDTQCAHETVPQSAKSHLIQQVWDVPPKRFTEANVHCVHPSTALFHRCKNGTLIDVLCRRYRAPAIPLPQALQPPTPTKVHRLIHGQTTVTWENKVPPRPATSIHEPPVEVALPEPTVIAPYPNGKMHILMCSFARDAEFTSFALRSYDKFARGFSGLTLLIPESDRNHFRFIPPSVTIKTFKEEPGKGFLHHMIQVCRADEICPPDTDFILHLDPDCLFWQATRPADFAPDGKPLLVREAYPLIEPRNKGRLKWRECVQRATGYTPEYDTMVRHPNVYPKALYSHVRFIVEQHTKQPFDSYVFSCQNKFPQTFCEYVTLGNIGLRDFPQAFTIRDYDHEQDSIASNLPNRTHQYIYRKGRDPVVEFWSHGGLNRYRSVCNQVLTGRSPAFVVK